MMSASNKHKRDAISSFIDKESPFAPKRINVERQILIHAIIR